MSLTFRFSCFHLNTILPRFRLLWGLSPSWYQYFYYGHGLDLCCWGGRTVQAAACRAALCGFNSHPQLFYLFWAFMGDTNFPSYLHFRNSFARADARSCYSVKSTNNNYRNKKVGKIHYTARSWLLFCAPWKNLQLQNNISVVPEKLKGYRLLDLSELNLTGCFWQ